MYSPLSNRSLHLTTSETTSMDANSSGLQTKFNVDNLNDSSARTPSFLFGQKRKSIGHGNAPYSNNPYAGQSAPSNDIFASPIPGQFRGESSVSGKSVHWSPALVQERSQSYEASRSTLKTLPSQGSGQFTHTSNFSPAPPLRSIRDNIEPVRKAVRRSMTISAADALPASVPASKPSSASARSSADTWVTVYGFPPEEAANVIKHFSRHGEIVSHQVPSKGNWMHIRYSSVVHAQQALSRNATFIDSSLRIGVVPCTDKEIVGVDTSEMSSPVLSRSLLVDQSVRAEMEHEIPAITPSKENQDSMDDLMNRSRLSMASRSGMRSLSISHDTRPDLANVQPVKHGSIIDKLWTAVGL